MTRFFRDTRLKTSFFHPRENDSIEGSSANSGQDCLGGAGSLRPDSTENNLSYRRLRFIASNKTLDEKLEMLMRNAENLQGEARHNYLEQMLLLIKHNPILVNHIPKKFHCNPLELTLNLGKKDLARELVALQGQVRPEFRNLIRDLLAPKPVNGMRFVKP